ncbi:unnamed protein product [Spodoptera exigua]|nr:unnamed protein product [Spodoptera exigua]
MKTKIYDIVDFKRKYFFSRARFVGYLNLYEGSGASDRHCFIVSYLTTSKMDAKYKQNNVLQYTFIC